MAIPRRDDEAGCLTAYWSLADDALCQILAVLLGDKAKAEAALYSTINHKARQDLVMVVGTHSNLDERAMDYLKFSLKTLGDAADARNRLIPGLFKVELYSGELVSVHRRPATKVPTITRGNILKQLTDAIALCERAVGLMGSTALAIRS
jgi:hypothetical protein